MSQIMQTCDFPDDCNEMEYLSELRSRLLADSTISVKHESKLSEDDKFLQRYLRKYNYDVDRSERAIGKYMKMLEKLSSKKVLERKYPKEVLQLCHGIVAGKDYDNRQVFLLPSMGTDSKRYLDKSDDEALDILTECGMKCIYAAEKVMEESEAEAALFILDLGVIPYAQYCHKKTMEFVLYLLKDIVRLQPQMASKVIVVNAPWPFKSFLKFLLAFIKVPVEIVVYSSKDVTWREKLRDHIPESSLPPEFGGSMKKAREILHYTDLYFPSSKS